MGERLVRAGVVSEGALAHARGVQRRGFGGSVVELLVDLEYVDEDEMARVLVELSGASLWTGQHVRRAPKEWLEGKRAHYAAVDPFDMETRRRMARQMGAREAVPHVATRSRMHDPEDVASMTMEEWVSADDPAVRRFLAMDQAAQRAAWEQGGLADHPLTRATNYLLLTMFAPGRVLRVRAFASPEITIGTFRKAKSIPIGLPRLALAILHRLEWMALAPLGPGLRRGWLNLLVPPTHQHFEVCMATTRSGEALFCQRRTPYAGLQGLEGTELAELRRACDATEDLAVRERNARLALERSNDAELLLDRLWALETLARILDATEREADSSLLVEEALELISRHEIGGRAEGEFRAIRAANEVSSAPQRAQLFAEARRAACAPGIGRALAFPILQAELEAQSVAGNANACARLAEAIVAEERALFGGSTIDTWALAVGAATLAKQGHIEDAQAMLQRIGAPVHSADRWVIAHARGVAAAAAGKHHDAVVLLEQALDLPGCDVVAVAADLARELLACGRTNEAIALAHRVTEVRAGWANQEAAAELERVRRMAPYR